MYPLEFGDLLFFSPESFSDYARRSPRNQKKRQRCFTLNKGMQRKMDSRLSRRRYDAILLLAHVVMSAEVFAVRVYNCVEVCYRALLYEARHTQFPRSSGSYSKSKATANQFSVEVAFESSTWTQNCKRHRDLSPPSSFVNITRASFITRGLRGPLVAGLAIISLRCLLTCSNERSHKGSVRGERAYGERAKDFLCTAFV